MVVLVVAMGSPYAAFVLPIDLYSNIPHRPMALISHPANEE